MDYNYDAHYCGPCTVQGKFPSILVLALSHVTYVALAVYRIAAVEYTAIYVLAGSCHHLLSSGVSCWLLLCIRRRVRGWTGALLDVGSWHFRSVGHLCVCLHVPSECRLNGWSRQVDWISSCGESVS